MSLALFCMMFYSSPLLCSFKKKSCILPNPRSWIAHFVSMHVGMDQRIIMETQTIINPLCKVV
jgi:hypothetical protein